MVTTSGSLRRFLSWKRLYSSVNFSEVSKFDNVARDWWKPDSKSGVGLLHQLNRLRVQYIRREYDRAFGKEIRTAQPLKGVSIADIGCGGGILSESLSRLGASMVSVDPGVENIMAAKKHAEFDADARTIDYQCGSCEVLIEKKATFQVVCAMEVIEHVDDPLSFVDSLTKLVKPNGLLFLSSINRTFLSYILAIQVAENVLGLLPPGTHDWRKFVAPEDIAHRVKQRHMQLQDLSGMIGNPLRNNWRLDQQYPQVNYILCAKKSIKAKDG